MECSAARQRLVAPDGLEDALDVNTVAAGRHQVCQQIARLGRDPAFLRALLAIDPHAEAAEALHDDRVFLRDGLQPLPAWQVLKHAVEERAALPRLDQRLTDHSPALPLVEEELERARRLDQPERAAGVVE